MMHIDEYCSLHNVTRRWVKELVNRKHLPSTKINGQRFIIVPPAVNGSISPEKFKEQMRSYVKTSGKAFLPEAFKRIKEYEKATGTNLRGLSKRTLYGLADGTRTVHHKKRSDSGQSRNANLLLSREKINAMLAYIYMESGEPSTMFACKRIQELAQGHESLYEIAAIPQGTLYRHCANFIETNDYQSCWQYYNRHQQWIKSLLTIQGAFTDRIEFMDYIAFDDRKADVAGSWWYDEISGKWRLRKVWYWIAIEMLTMMPVGYVILPREPNSDDVINVLIQSMIQVGLPKKGYLFDNGIGNSDKVRKFIERVRIQATGSGYFEKEYKPVAPYEPTHKSNIELFNRHIKKEFFRENNKVGTIIGM